MSKISILFVFISFFLLLFIGSTLSQNESSLLVNTEWLEENLDNPSILIFHVGKKQEFDKKHIPGAVLFPVMEIFQQTSENLKHEIPPIVQLNDVVRSIGIQDDSQIVLYYSKDWLTVATRVYLTFDYIGLGEQTSILDGGLEQWLEEGRATTSDILEMKKSEITLHINEDALIDVNWVKDNLRNSEVVIVDGRPEEFYDGSEKEDHIAKYGHITGAVNIPFVEITIEETPYKFRDKKELETLFLESGIKQGSTVVAYCNTGVWATLVYFTSKYLGYSTHFYDGSFEEWAADDLLPVTEPVKLDN
jgi:thiosulfate/3-mercaptopyruvate sulfurtransferase